MKATAVPGRSAARTGSWWAFVVLEVLAVLAVPVVAFVGARALLDTRAGTFVTGPGPADPGFQALVDPTPVQAVVERRDGRLTGITVLARPGAEVDGGSAILVPAELEVDGQTLADWGEDGDQPAVDALAGALRLSLGDAVAVDDDGWADLLGDRTLSVDNPDPVVVDGARRFAPGTLELGADDATDWLGQLGGQQPAALLFRRQLWWEALLGSGSSSSDGTEGAGDADTGPPEGGAVDDPGGEDTELADTIDAIAAGPSTVELLPVDQGRGAVVLAPEAAEELIVDVVPFPAGFAPGDRLRVRVLDRTGAAQPDDIARRVALAGGEVVVVGNAGTFDGQPTEAVVTSAELEEPARRLIERIGTGTVTVSPEGDDTIDVTVLAGPDLVGQVDS